MTATREITTHKTNVLNRKLRLTAHSTENDPGGAPHVYAIEWIAIHQHKVTVEFHRGPGGTINGITNEVLLAIVRDRLEQFQAGDFGCVENEIAIKNIGDAMDALAARSSSRADRGVEGKNIP